MEQFSPLPKQKKKYVLPAATREAFLLAGRSLLRYHEIMRTGPQVFTGGKHSDFVNDCRRYIVYSQLAGVSPTPKLHIAMHVTKAEEIHTDRVVELGGLEIVP